MTQILALPGQAVRLRVWIVLLVLAGLGFYFMPSGNSAAAQGSHVALADLNTPIDSVSAGYLARAIEAAHEDGAEALIVRVDTPGGTFSATIEMVEALSESGVPVISFVSPRGAIAASAGTFIVAAAHVAAMAPGTSIGAASPIDSTGEDLPDTAKKKATELAAATLRSIAQDRGRNVEALEDTVFSARSYSATEALDLNVVDIMAANVAELLEQVDGRTVQMTAGPVTLRTEGLGVIEIERTYLERFLGLIADPNIVFILFAIGGMGLVAELFNPGTIVPGTIGVICLALTFVAIGTLPVNWLGVGLIAVAMLLFYGELQVSGLGILSVLGGIALVIGGILLFGDPTAPDLAGYEIRVSPWVLGIVSAAVLGMVGLLVWFALSAKKAPKYSSPYEHVIGAMGVAATDLRPEGTVRVTGEPWSAASADGDVIRAGERVIVLDMEGLTLRVERAPEELA